MTAEKKYPYSISFDVGSLGAPVAGKTGQGGAVSGSTPRLP